MMFFLNNAKVKHINTAQRTEYNTIAEERKKEDSHFEEEEEEKNAHGYLYLASSYSCLYIRLVLDLYASSQKRKKEKVFRYFADLFHRSFNMFLLCCIYPLQRECLYDLWA